MSYRLVWRAVETLDQLLQVPSQLLDRSIVEAAVRFDVEMGLFAVPGDEDDRDTFTPCIAHLQVDVGPGAGQVGDHQVGRLDPLANPLQDVARERRLVDPLADEPASPNRAVDPELVDVLELLRVGHGHEDVPLGRRRPGGCLGRRLRGRLGWGLRGRTRRRGRGRRNLRQRSGRFIARGRRGRVWPGRRLLKRGGEEPRPPLVPFDEGDLFDAHRFFALEGLLESADHALERFRGIQSVPHAVDGRRDPSHRAWLAGKDFDGTYIELGYGTEIGGFDTGIALISADDTLAPTADSTGAIQGDVSVVFSLGKSFDL